jgi:hypothetical protein
MAIISNLYPYPAAVVGEPVGGGAGDGWLRKPLKIAAGSSIGGDGHT